MAWDRNVTYRCLRESSSVLQTAGKTSSELLIRRGTLMSGSSQDFRLLNSLPSDAQDGRTQRTGSHQPYLFRLQSHQTPRGALIFFLCPDFSCDSVCDMMHPVTLRLSSQITSSPSAPVFALF